jgi:homoserine dehydrogenase
MSDKIRIGLAGLGTVGAPSAATIAARRSAGAQLVAVSARDASIKTAAFDHAAIAFEADPLELIVHQDDVDVVVELMGGADGPALALVRPRLKRASRLSPPIKPCWPHAAPLSDLSVGGNVPLAFEAAVAGGIPVIKTLREGLAGNDISPFAAF